MLQTDIAGMCGEHSQYSCHAGCARAHGCVLSPSTLLRLPAALYGVGPALRAVPVFRYSTKARTRLGLRFVPSPAQVAQAARSLMGALSPGVVHLILSVVPASVSARPSWVHAPCVYSRELASRQRPSQRMSTIQNLRKSLVRNWRPVCSLIGDTPLGPSLPLSPPPCLLPLVGDGPSATG